jgi:2-polyprenyl-6-methoxyphenol hydroxylase-like FAD-dependent oxidoreductase
VRQWAGLDEHIRHQQRFAFRRHYRISPWTNCMELHWGRSCQVYVTPVAPNEICVAAISRDPRLRLDAALAELPVVVGRLEGLERTSVERGAVSATRKLRHVSQGRIALVGDASGSVDAITGEGLCLSFRQAMVLSECFSAGSLNQYPARHRSLARRPALMSRLMLTLEDREWFRKRVMQALATEPQTFARMLALHVGVLTPLSLAGIGLSLGWDLLTI